MRSFNHGQANASESGRTTNGARQPTRRAALLSMGHQRAKLAIELLAVTTILGEKKATHVNVLFERSFFGWRDLQCIAATQEKYGRLPQILGRGGLPIDDLPG